MRLDQSLTRTRQPTSLISGQRYTGTVVSFIARWSLGRRCMPRDQGQGWRSGALPRPRSQRISATMSPAGVCDKTSQWPPAVSHRCGVCSADSFTPSRMPQVVISQSPSSASRSAIHSGPTCVPEGRVPCQVRNIPLLRSSGPGRDRRRAERLRARRDAVWLLMRTCSKLPG